jgi:NAD+ diphosphatase
VAVNTFTGAELDRADDARRRDAAWVAAQAEDAGARAVVAGSAGVRMADGRLARVPLGEAARTATAEPILLGLDADGPLFAVDEGPLGDGPPPLVGAGGRRGEPASAAEGRLGLREAGAVLPQADGGLAAYAAGLLNWHRRHRFCSNCGAETEHAEGGLVRRCPACRVEHHPRTDPVVIMLVTDDDRVLLGRQPSWPARRYSALAGFVAPGESLEEAVAREVAEEAGVTIGPPVYESSQPWPFPSSLMLGFTAPWTAGEPDARDSELEDVGWFSRDHVAGAARHDTDGWDIGRAAPAGVDLLLPPRLAIARRLLDGWLDEEL